MATGAHSPVLCPVHIAQKAERLAWARKKATDRIVKDNPDIEAQTKALMRDEFLRQRRNTPTTGLMNKAQKEIADLKAQREIDEIRKSRPVRAQMRRHRLQPEWLIEQRALRRSKRSGRPLGLKRRQQPLSQ